MDHLIARAVRACACSALRAGGNPPVIERTSVDLIGGRRYVTLRSGGNAIAVYRVRTAGQLKRMKRPPAELAGQRRNSKSKEGDDDKN